MLIVGCLRLLAWTWRVRLIDEAGLLESRQPLIWVFWHNRLLVIPIIYERFFQSRRSAVLISRSRDGGIAARCIELFGAQAVRGSTSRGGASALRELQRLVGEGFDAYITPDGPKGPRYSVGAGAIWLAQNSGARLLPVSVEASRCWRLGRWDGFLIPKPFARIEVTLRAPHTVEATDRADEGAMPGEQERLRGLMMGQTGRQ